MITSSKNLNPGFWHGVIGSGLATIFVALIALTWMKWFDLYVDSFRDAWVADQLIQGKLLYREVYYEYGFFIPVVYSGLFRLFGTHLSVVVGVGMVVGAATISLIYVITHQLMKPLGRPLWTLAVPGLVSLVYLLVFAFSPSSVLFNTIVPYTHSTTVFVLGALVALTAFLRIIDGGGRGATVLWGLGMSLAACCRPMMMLPVGLAFCIAWILWVWHNRATWPIKQLAIALGFPVLTTLLSYGVFFGSYGTGTDFLTANIFHALWAKDTHFSHFHLGLVDVSASFSGIVYALGHHVVFLLLPLVVAHRYVQRPWLGALLGLFGVGFVFWWVDPYIMTDLFRTLTILLPLAALIYGWRAIREGRPQDIALLTTVLVAGAVGTRIALRMTPVDYGFCLLIPGLIVYFVLLFRFAARLGDVDENPQWRALVLGSVAVIFVGFSALFSQRTLHQFASEVTHTKSTPYGTITTANAPQNQYFWRTLDYLETHAEDTESVAVIPEGIGINWFGKHPTPLKFYHVNPHQAAQLNATAFVAELSAKPFEWVVIPNRHSPEFDDPIFGVDYHQELYQWVQSEFTLVEQYGAAPTTPDQAGVQIWLRNAR